MNPFQLLQALKSSGNPRNFMLNMLQSQMGNTPIGKNLIDMAGAGDSAGIESIVRNIVSSRGGDFDKEFSQFKQTLGLK